MTADIKSLHSAPGSKFEDVCIGDAVGFVDGPGVFPTDNIGVVLGFGEFNYCKHSWGEFVVVRRPDGRTDRVQSFTTIGIGIYHLPTYLIEQDQKRRAA